MARTRGFSPNVMSAINLASQRVGIPANFLRAIAGIESSGNPRATTGSYYGLFQLSPSEFKRAGGTGDIFDPTQNAMAAGRLFAGYKQEFRNKYGREATPVELWVAHNQGWGGLQAHMNNPDRPAWMNMADTAEGRQKGIDWAKRAVAGNIPQASRSLGPDLTSREFMDAWEARLERGGIPRVTPTQVDIGVASAAPEGATPSEPQGRRLQDMSAAELTALAPPKTSIYEDMVGHPVSVPIDGTTPIVSGIEPSAGTTVGGIFSGVGLAGIGRGLSAAGRAIVGSGIKVPSFEDPAKQMAALDAGAYWPTIQLLRRRRSPGGG